MSALPPKADIPSRQSECPLWANNRLMHRSKMSCYPITSSARIRIVGGTVTPIALAVFEVDKKLKFRGLLNRKIGGVRPFEDLVDERACASVQGRHVQSIGCKHAGFPLLAGKRNGRQSLPGPEGGAFAGDGRHGSIIPSRGAARSRVCRLSLAPAVSVAAPIAGTPVATARIAGCVVIIPGPHHWR